jgi:hypothetical protein
MSRSLDDTTRLRGGASAARLGAIGPGVPVGNHAVDGTEVGVACYGNRERRASSARALRAERHSARPCDSTSVTKLGAKTKVSPISDSTILVVGFCVAHTCHSVAGLVFNHVGARSTAKATRGHDITSAHLAASAALGRAQAPGSPFADDAANGTSVSVAVLGLGQHGTCETAVSSSNNDGATMVDGTPAAGLTATAPTAPL